MEEISQGTRGAQGISKAHRKPSQEAVPSMSLKADDELAT